MSDSQSIPTHELLRSKDGNWIKEACYVLHQAGIPFRLSETKVIVDLDSEGQCNLPSGDCCVLIPSENWDAARHIYQAYVEAYELPELHFLQSATDEDLIDVLAEPDKWQGFDVARARHMARQRGLNVETILRNRIASLHQGIAASRGMLLAGWLLSPTLLCLPIALTLAFKKVYTTHGEFHAYDKRSRDHGTCMLIAQMCVLMAVMALAAMMRK